MQLELRCQASFGLKLNFLIYVWIVLQGLVMCTIHVQINSSISYVAKLLLPENTFYSVVPPQGILNLIPHSDLVCNQTKPRHTCVFGCKSPHLWNGQPSRLNNVIIIIIDY